MLCSYYYDIETGWYYLQSRYYDPVIHRFINADCLASTGQGFIGTNMFAYCLNNPVMMIDSTGYIGAEGAVAAANWWNPFGWIMAAVVLVEVVIIVAAVVDQVSDSDTETIYGDKTNSAGNSQSAEKPVAAAPASPQPPNNNNNNNRRNNNDKNNLDPNYRGKSTYNKDGLRIDYEYYGNGNGNVHAHYREEKYMLNTNTMTFPDAPKSVQNLLMKPEVWGAILKALMYITG